MADSQTNKADRTRETINANVSNADAQLGSRSVEFMFLPLVATSIGFERELLLTTRKGALELRNGASPTTPATGRHRLRILLLPR